MYKALFDFTDRKTEGYGFTYKQGEPYPKEGLNIDPEYIEFLLSNKTSSGKPFIEFVPDEQEEQPEPEPELAPIPFDDEPEEQPRRKRKRDE